MFIADRLIYLELQKTGSRHIVRWLRRSVGGKEKGQHNRLSQRAQQKFDRYLIGSVRNPWDWYISVWAFACSSRGAVFKALKSGNLTRELGVLLIRHPEIFRQVAVNPSRMARALRGKWSKPTSEWRRTLADSDSPALFRDWLKMMLDEERKYDYYGQGFALSPISSFAGFLTYRYLWLYSKDISRMHASTWIDNWEDLFEFDRENNLLDFVVRTEHMGEDLVEAMEQAGYTLEEEDREAVLGARRTNVSSHSSSAHYYDEETVALVADREQLIIEKHGYQPPILDSCQPSPEEALVKS